jgi:hypothetical protein
VVIDATNPALRGSNRHRCRRRRDVRVLALRTGNRTSA